MQFGGAEAAPQERPTWLALREVTTRLVGEPGTPWHTGPEPGIGYMFWTSILNCAENQPPESGASGRAPVSTPYCVVYVGSHMRSSALP